MVLRDTGMLRGKLGGTNCPTHSTIVVLVIDLPKSVKDYSLTCWGHWELESRDSNDGDHSLFYY